MVRWPLIFCLILGGCSVHVRILRASQSPAGTSDLQNIETIASGPQSQPWEKFTLAIKTDELVRVLEKESSIYINVFDCTSSSTRFPSVAFFRNISLDEEHGTALDAIERNPSEVTINGYAPSSFVAGLNSTCVRLEGGSYGGASLQSNHIKLP